MKITLTRFCSHPDMGTFGKLNIDDMNFFTVERPWLDNKPMISCIPAGKYALEPHDSPKHPDTWALVNDSLRVSHYPFQDHRYAILIHPGNTMQDVQGCIAPGLKLGSVKGKWAVLSSRDAYTSIIHRIQPGDIIEILWEDFNGSENG